MISAKFIWRNVQCTSWRKAPNNAKKNGERPLYEISEYAFIYGISGGCMGRRVLQL